MTLPTGGNCERNGTCSKPVDAVIFRRRVGDIPTRKILRQIRKKCSSGNSTALKKPPNKREIKVENFICDIVRINYPLGKNRYCTMFSKNDEQIS